MNNTKNKGKLAEELIQQANRELLVGIMSFKGNYQGIISPYEQVRILGDAHKSLKNATFDESVLEKQLPETSEGYVVFPHNTKELGFNYTAACRSALGLLVRSRRLDIKIDIHNDTIFRSKESDLKIKKLIETQTKRKKHKLIIAPAQLGLKYFHTPPIKVKNKMSVNEVGLGLFESVFILFSHPDRLSCTTDFSFVCIGDEYVDNINEQGVNHPEFNCCDSGDGADMPDRLWLGMIHDYNESLYFNSSIPTLFLPE